MTSRPRARWWWMVAAYIVVLFASQPRLGFMVDAVKERWGEVALGTGLTIVAVAGGLALVAWISRLWSVATVTERVLLGSAMLLYGVGIAALDIPQERLHYLEYGLLAGLVYNGLARGNMRARSAAAVAVVATAAIGWLDEELQGRLWERRYFDWRDVQLNVQAAMLGTLVAVPLRSALDRRHRDRV